MNEVLQGVLGLMAFSAYTGFIWMASRSDRPIENVNIQLRAIEDRALCGTSHGKSTYNREVEHSTVTYCKLCELPMRRVHIQTWGSE